MSRLRISLSAVVLVWACSSSGQDDLSPAAPRDASDGDALAESGALDGSDARALDGGSDAFDAAVDAGKPHVAFVTEETYSGDLVGAANALVLDGGAQAPDGGAFAPEQWRAAADALCVHSARGAGLTGDFRVVLASDPSVSVEEIADTDGPWALVDGSPVAETSADLFVGNLHNAVTVTAQGTTQSSNAWGNGNSAQDCSHWTATTGSGVVGEPASVGRAWLDATLASCSSKSALYCFEVGPGAGPNRYPMAPVGAKLAFHANGPFRADFAADGGAGDAVHVRADGFCQQAAVAAGRAGTFRAWISSPVAGAHAHFTALAMTGPWHRPDGFRVAATLDALTSDAGIEHQISYAADGGFAGTRATMTASTTDGVLDPQNCAGFTTTTGPLRGSYTSTAGPEWASRYGIDCNDSSLGLHCFEQ